MAPPAAASGPPTAPSADGDGGGHPARHRVGDRIADAVGQDSRDAGELLQTLGVVQGVFTEAGQDRLALDNLAYRPRARGQDGRLLDEVSVRVDGTGEQGRLAARWRLWVILAVLVHEDVADLAEIVDTAEHLVAPDLAGRRRAEFPARFPRHRIPWTEVNDMLLGINLGQLLGAEHLHGVPETYDLRSIIGHFTVTPESMLCITRVSHHGCSWRCDLRSFT